MKLYITFSQNVQSFAEKLVELSESFNLEEYIQKHLNSSKKHIQLIKYKGLDDNTEENVGFKPHIDRQFLTILCQNDVVADDSEIQTEDGENWIKAKPSQDSSFLVIAGASLHLLLNGRVFTPLHRVVITGKKDRYVVGLFLPPKEGVVINAPGEIVDEEHPRLYKPFDFEAYLKFTSKYNKGRDLFALKAYCAL